MKTNKVINTAHAEGLAIPIQSKKEKYLNQISEFFTDKISNAFKFLKSNKLKAIVNKIEPQTEFIEGSKLKRNSELVNSLSDSILSLSTDDNMFPDLEEQGEGEYGEISVEHPDILQMMKKGKKTSKGSEEKWDEEYFGPMVDEKDGPVEPKERK